MVVNFFWARVDWVLTLRRTRRKPSEEVAEDEEQRPRQQHRNRQRQHPGEHEIAEPRPASRLGGRCYPIDFGWFRMNRGALPSRYRDSVC